MGQKEIIKALKIEREFKNKEYLNVKDIQKALENIGCIVRRDRIHKSIRKMNKNNIVELKEKNEFRKSYRLKNRYLNMKTE